MKSLRLSCVPWLLQKYVLASVRACGANGKSPNIVRNIQRSISRVWPMCCGRTLQHGKGIERKSPVNGKTKRFVRRSVAVCKEAIPGECRLPTHDGRNHGV